MTSKELPIAVGKSNANAALMPTAQLFPEWTLPSDVGTIVAHLDKSQRHMPKPVFRHFIGSTHKKNYTVASYQ